MKVKVIGISHYTKQVNGHDYDRYTVYYVRKPHSYDFRERDINGLYCGSVSGGEIFSSVELEKCYEFVEATIRAKNGSSFVGVVDVNAIDKI